MLSQICGKFTIWTSREYIFAVTQFVTQFTQEEQKICLGKTVLKMRYKKSTSFVTRICQTLLTLSWLIVLILNFFILALFLKVIF